MPDIRNIAIIAHVDHGKTTLIDSILAQTGIFRENQQVAERIMDSNDLEKERGITILAKCTSVNWKHGEQNTRINIIDTPGHADFGGEVERVLSMVDGVLLLVDAAEGAMPQTKFVLSKALKLGLRPIVVINKIDRSDGRPDEVIDEVFDLFVSLDASDEQLDFPILYAAGRDGWCVEELEDKRENIYPLLERIVKHVDAPQVDPEAPFSMLVTMISYDAFLGRILTGRIYSGRARVNMPLKAINLKGSTVEQGRLSKLRIFEGVKSVSTESAEAGDIVSIAGVLKGTVADTICDMSITDAIASTPIDPPTMSITISVNDSPLAGQEGKKLTSRVIGERLFRESESNVAINVKETEAKNGFEVGGRGELQLGVLVETMRREGFELSVSRPTVIMRKNETTGKIEEPIEELVVDVDDEFTGVVVEKLSLRKADMVDMRPSGGGKTRIVFHVPSRGLIGYHCEFLTDTRGTGIMNRIYHNYSEYKGEITHKKRGALISMGSGEVVAYSLWNLRDRGIMFIKPQDKVYTGMIVGENNRDNDLEVNVMKGKNLTNVRAAKSDEAIRLVPPTIFSLEEMMSYIGEDELVEVTPSSLRLRKTILDYNERKKANKSKKKLVA